MTTRLIESAAKHRYLWICDHCGFEQKIDPDKPDREWRSVEMYPTPRMLLCPPCVTELPDWLVGRR